MSGLMHVSDLSQRGNGPCTGPTVRLLSRALARSRRNTPTAETTNGFWRHYGYNVTVFNFCRDEPESSQIVVVARDCFDGGGHKST